MIEAILSILVLFVATSDSRAANNVYVVDNSQYDINYNNNPSFPATVNEYALQSQIASPTLNYEKMNLIELNQQAKIESSSLQEMQENDKAARENTLRDETAQVIAESIPGQDKYQPISDPSLEEK